MGKSPVVDNTAFVAPTASVIGDVSIGHSASVWHGVVLRGDVDGILVGECTNIQDNTVVHTDRHYGKTLIEGFVTVGHACILHACTLKFRSFVGMGSVVMDNAVLESESMLAAGSLLTRGKVVGHRELWAGRPAKYVRDLTPEEVLFLTQSAENYVELARQYMC